MTKKRKRKSALAKARENPASAYWRRRADKAWSLAVRARAGNACEICGAKENIQAHHLLDRSYSPTRHELRNGIALCALHHKYSRFQSAHRGGLLFHSWFKATRPDDEFILYVWAVDGMAFQAEGTKLPKPNYAKSAMILEAFVGKESTSQVATT